MHAQSLLCEAYQCSEVLDHYYASSGIYNFMRSTESLHSAEPMVQYTPDVHYSC